MAVMLVLLGALNVHNVLRRVRTAHDALPRRSMRPLVVGIVHGLAGSAAVALLVLGTISDPLLAMGYLTLFGIGTIAGMLVITMGLAMPIASAAHRFARLHRALGLVTGVGSILFGALLIYEIGFAKGLFTSAPRWTPQ